MILKTNDQTKIFGKGGAKQMSQSNCWDFESLELTN